MAGPTDGIVTLRAPDSWKIRVALAASLRGVSRSEFVRTATLKQAELDLEKIAPVAPAAESFADFPEALDDDDDDLPF